MRFVLLTSPFSLFFGHPCLILDDFSAQILDSCWLLYKFCEFRHRNPEVVNSRLIIHVVSPCSAYYLEVQSGK
jgi:hypothetical protein